MTTSVIYGSSLRGQDIQYGTVNPNVAASIIYSNLNTFLNTGVSRTRFTNATGSTINPTAVFSGTPASGTALLCVLLRTADNIASTMPAGWTLLTGNGAGGVRRAEVWWKRAGASEPTSVTMTNATAAAWNMTLIEYDGWAKLADPVVISAAATVASSTSVAVAGTGMMAGIVGLVNGAGSWGTATLADTTGANASRTALAATTQADCSEIVGYDNYEDSSCTYTLGTARATTRLVVGWPHNTKSDVAPFGAFAGVQNTGGGLEGQIGIEFDTSSIPIANTVSAATLTMTSGGSTALWPSSADSEIWSINSTPIAKTPSNTRTVWRTPTEIAALTKVASRAAGSAWTTSTPYAWTSDATFPAAINKASTTRLLVGTTEQRTGTLSGESQVYNISSTAGDHFLTIVHQRETTIPTVVATANATAPLDLVAYKRTLPALTVTSSATAPNRSVNYFRSIISSVSTIPVVARFANLFRTTTVVADTGTSVYGINTASNPTGRWYEGSGGIRQIDSVGSVINVVDGSGGMRQVEGGQ